MSSADPGKRLSNQSVTWQGHKVDRSLPVPGPRPTYLRLFWYGHLWVDLQEMGSNINRARAEAVGG